MPLLALCCVYSSAGEDFLYLHRKMIDQLQAALEAKIMNLANPQDSPDAFSLTTHHND